MKTNEAINAFARAVRVADQQHEQDRLEASIEFTATGDLSTYLASMKMDDLRHSAAVSNAAVSLYRSPDAKS